MWRRCSSSRKVIGGITSLLHASMASGTGFSKTARFRFREPSVLSWEFDGWPVHHLAAVLPRTNEADVLHERRGRRGNMANLMATRRCDLLILTPGNGDDPKIAMASSARMGEGDSQQRRFSILMPKHHGGGVLCPNLRYGSTMDRRAGDAAAFIGILIGRNACGR